MQTESSEVVSRSHLTLFVLLTLSSDYNSEYLCVPSSLMYGYPDSVSGLRMSAVLTRIYGKAALEDHAYSRTLSSLAFAGTIVGMLLFGTFISLAHNRMVRLKHWL